MKKGTWINIILIAIFFLGLSLLLYPAVSDYWNSLNQSRIIANYAEEVSAIDTEKYDEMRQTAREYNLSLVTNPERFYPTPESQALYRTLLDVSGSGIIGYIEIPSIACNLPIYHGVDATVLQFAVGHLEGSSLPIGGPSTHSILSAHRGLPSARLFTDLDQVVVGDVFMIQTLDETLTYEVDQILVVEPQETEALDIFEEKDFCTLVTCTPYGINSHRLLVRGHRIENMSEAKTVRITADAIQIEPIIVAPVVATPMLLLLVIAVALPGGKKKKKTGGDSNVA